MSSTLNKLFVTLLISFLVVSIVGIVSAKIVQSDVKNDLKKISLSGSDEKITSALGLKITNAMPEDEIPVIVFMKKPDKITSKTALQSLLSSAVESGGGKVGRKYDIIDAFSAKMPAAKISKLSEMPEVERIYYDEIVSLPPQPASETGILMTKSTQTIGANYVWNTLGYTGTGIKVAIIDTGVNYNHPDLGGGFGSGKKVADGYDFVNNDADPMDDNGHGTHVAGTVAANGSIKGVAPNATLFAVKVLNSAGSGSTSNVIAGIDWSIAHGANVISMSLGGSGQPNDEFADVLNIVSDAAVDKGVVMVIAAGNEGPGTGTTGSPGSSKKVITVGASSSAGTVTISDDTIASFSSRSPSAFGRLDPEVVAPGVSINSTSYTGGYTTLSGTSMATPHVSGAAALLLQKNPALTPAQIRAILMNTASNLTTSNIHVFEKGAGIINLTNAFTYNISASINGDDRWEESVIIGFSTIGRLVLNNNNAQSVNFTFSFEATTDIERDNSIPASSFNLPGYEIVNAGSSKIVNITFTPPSGVKPAIYGTTLIAFNSTAGTLRIPVVITIPLIGSGSIQGTVNNAAVKTSLCISSPLSCNGDWIYYKLKSYNGTALKAYLNWTDSNDDLDLYLFAPNGVLLSYSELGTGVSEVVTLSNMVYDEYWVAVHAYTLSGSGSYYLNVSYPTGTKGKLEVSPSSSQVVAASNEVKNITFSITNDATAKSNLNLSVKKLMVGGNKFTSGTIANTGSFYSRVWDVSSSGMNFNNTRYMNVTLQWVNPANNLDFLLAYYDGTQWFSTRFESAHNNAQLNQAWERLENVDIQHYLKNYPDFGVFIKNTGSSETYNLTINFTDTAPWSGASVNETSISLSSGQTRQVKVTINGSQIDQNVTDLVFAIQDSTEDYAAVPIRINLNSTTTTTAVHGAPNITSFAPASAVVDDLTGATREFNITVNQTVNVTWYINGTSVQTNTSVTGASYTNGSAALGTWNVSAVASNANGSAMRTWVWTVTSFQPPPATVSIGNFSVVPGGTVTGSLNASGVTNLGTATINLTYDPSVVIVTAVAHGSGNALNAPIFNINNTTGVVQITADSTTGKSGDVIIADITFQAVGNAGQSSPLNINIRELVDTSGSPITGTPSNGTFTILPASAATVSIGNFSVASGGTVTGSLNASGVTNLGSATVNLTYNPSVVFVTAVSAGSGNALDAPIANINNATGVVQIIADSATGKSGDVIIALITMQAVGSAGQYSPLNININELVDTNFDTITAAPSNGSFNIQDNESPVVTNPSASPATILNDNGRARAPGTNITTINVTVTDNVAVGTVTINLSSIGGSANAPMTDIGGNVYSITTNATAGINLTNNLVVNATDTSGNSNNSVSVQLTVLRRGDVVRSNTVTGADALFIKRFVVGLETMTPQQLFVADVTPANSSGTVTGADALYIKRYAVGLEAEP